MKYFQRALLLLFVVSGGNVSAQTIKVIDKSEKTAILFDESNPRSFVNLLMQNVDVLERCEPIGIPVEDLSATQRKALIPLIGVPGTIPLLVEDPSSPDFGDPLIVTDPVTGMQSFVYDAPDTVFIDLKDVSRMILEFDSDKETGLEKVKSITLAKKYGDQYVPVLRCEGNVLLDPTGFRFWEQVSKEQEEWLVGDRPDSYWNQMRDTFSGVYDRYEELVFFPGEFALDFHTKYDIPEPLKEVYDVPRYLRREEIWKTLPFDAKLSTPYGNWLVSELDTLSPYFDTVIYEEYIDPVPLIDEDPNSVNFGEPLIYTSEDGLQFFVYSAPTANISWLGFSPEMHLISSLVLEGDKVRQHPEYFLMVKVSTDGKHLVAMHQLNAFWEQFAKGSISSEWETWYTSFRTALNSGKKRNLQSKKHRKKLNMSEGFWDHFETTGASN